MVKRLVAALLAITFLLGLSACASILDGETQVITAHEKPSPPDSGAVIQAENYDELKADALGFVMKHEESGLIHVYSYDGTLEGDVKKACNAIMHDEPIGAYAVSSMKANVTKIVSYYEVEFDISYNKKVTKQQLDSIVTVPTLRYMKSYLLSRLGEYDDSATILTHNLSVTSSDALGDVEATYYENPLEVVMAPVASVDVYPDHGTDRVIAFTFGYQYQPSTLKVMDGSLKNAVQHMAESVTGSNDGAILLSLCQRLTEYVSYDSDTASGEYSNQNMSATAYGALVNGSAVSEGYAMAYKALCDELGIECYVVRGTRGGRQQAWNIVALDGYYYHIDVSMCDVNGIATAFLKNDTDMKKNYAWDTTKYKPCNGPLTYSSLLNK